MILDSLIYWYYERLVDNSVIDGYMIDTVLCSDGRFYETAIKFGDGDWIVVEEYVTIEKAQKGHNKWIEFCKTHPKQAYSIQYRDYISF